MVVDVVGASPCGQASADRGNIRATVDPSASATVRPAGDSDQLDAEAAAIADDIAQFCGLAGVRKGHHHIFGPDHAHVAVAGFARVHEIGRRPDRRQGRGDLATDVAALAHPGHDEPAGRALDDIDSPAECVAQVAVQSRCQRRYAFAFQCENATCRRDIAAAIAVLHRLFGFSDTIFGAMRHGSRCSLSHILSAIASTGLPCRVWRRSPLFVSTACPQSVPSAR